MVAHATPAEVRARIASGEYVTTTIACERLGPDITPQRLRDWKRRPDVAVDIVRDPTGNPVRVPGRRGVENVWRWQELVAAEARLAASGRGRPRGVVLAGV